MTALRKAFFWLHLVAGVVAGLVVLVMAVTGVLLTYERQILAYADRGNAVEKPHTAPRRRPGELIEIAAATGRGYPTTITMRADASEPAQLAYGQDSVYMDAYTGAVIGEGSSQAHEFFRVVRNWHRWLAAEGQSRETARAVTGASNLAFLFLVASGFYLWWPRQWTGKHLRAISWFRGGLAGRARNFNWHNAIGLWCAVPLFVIVLGGVVISYPWASDLVYQLTGSPMPATKGGKKGGGLAKKGPPRGPGRQGPRDAGSPIQMPDLAAIDAFWPQAEKKVAGWRSISLRLPESARAPLVFTIDRGDGGQPQKRATLTIDQRTGEVREWTTFADGTPGQRLRSWLRFTHTGEYYGKIGQTVAGIVSAGAVVLVWTGFAMALARFNAWLVRRRRREVSAPEIAVARAGGME